MVVQACTEHYVNSEKGWCTWEGFLAEATRDLSLLSWEAP